MVLNRTKRCESYCLHRHSWSTIWSLYLEWDYDVIISRKSMFRFREKLWIPQESLRCSSNKESGTYEKMYMTQTVVWHDVVLIANPVNMVYSDHSVLIIHSDHQKTYSPPGRICNSLPPLPYFGQTLFPPLSNLPFFCSPPSKFTSPPHIEKMIGPLKSCGSQETT